MVKHDSEQGQGRTKTTLEGCGYNKAETKQSFSSFSTSTSYSSTSTSFLVAEFSRHHGRFSSLILIQTGPQQITSLPAVVPAAVPRHHHGCFKCPLSVQKKTFYLIPTKIRVSFPLRDFSSILLIIWHPRQCFLFCLQRKKERKPVHVYIYNWRLLQPRNSPISLYIQATLC